MFFKNFRTFKNFPFEKPDFYTKTPVLTQNSMFFKNFPVLKIPRSRNGVLTQNSVFFKNFRTFKKFSVQENGVLTQNSAFFKNFRVFKNSPFEKVYTFQKVDFSIQNMIHRHKHLSFPNALWYICHSLPHSTSKSYKKQAFKRTISTFDINYRDQKVHCIANLIPVERLRTNFRTF